MSHFGLPGLTWCCHMEYFKMVALRATHQNPFKDDHSLHHAVFDQLLRDFFLFNLKSMINVFIGMS
jgi:hypothetical protein